VRDSLDDLLHRIAKSDEEAMRLLYRSLSGDVFKFAFAMLHDFHAAQDVQQDTFLKVWKYASTFRGLSRSDSSARVWIFTMTRNLAVDYCRKNGRESPRGSFERQNESMGPRELDILHQRMDIYALIDTIPKDLADAVVLHAIGGYTLDESASILHISIPTLKRRCRKGLLMLREKIENLSDSISEDDENIGGQENADALE
jgi:RNA polymerase sigma factor (sigma-70 family)